MTLTRQVRAAGGRFIQHHPAHAAGAQGRGLILGTIDEVILVGG
jgi:hypothetical protein